MFVFFSSSKQFTPNPKLKSRKRLVFHSLLSLLARFSATATMTSVSIGKDRKSSRLLITHSIHAELIVGRIGHSTHKLIVWHPVGGIERQLFPPSFIMDAVAAASDCTGDIRQTKKKDTGFGHFPIFPITEWSGVLFFLFVLTAKWCISHRKPRGIASCGPGHGGKWSN